MCSFMVTPPFKWTFAFKLRVQYLTPIFYIIFIILVFYISFKISSPSIQISYRSTIKEIKIAMTSQLWDPQLRYRISNIYIFNIIFLYFKHYIFKIVFNNQFYTENNSTLLNIQCSGLECMDNLRHSITCGYKKMYSLIV